ncbi:MAG: neutral/alkaline non-lysosomal ceramidase N-terminal domain-containing protein [Pirellulaceae bacterium]
MSRSAIVLVTCLACLSASAVCAHEPLRVGVAEADITPPEGFPVAGYYHERLATGVRDPLKAKAIVLRGGHDRAAVVGCDLTGIAIDLSTEVRRRASAKTGIPADHIILTATHSHTAPDYTRDLYLYLQESAASDAPSQRYAARLIDGIVTAIVRANANLEPAVLAAGTATQTTPVSFNRRFVMRDGSVRTWMKLNNPEVVRAAGPIDPQIGLVLFRGPDQQPRGLLSNFALHLDTVGGTLWSADYPYFIEQSVRQALGSQVISVFGTGCCGDINHSDPSRAERNTTDIIGKSLGESIVGALPQLRPVTDPRLRVLRAVVPVPLQPAPPAQVERAQALLPQAKAGQKVEFFDLVTAYKSLMLAQLRDSSSGAVADEHLSWGLTHTWRGVGEKLPVEVHVLTFGTDVALVFLPGEIFVELGLAIKQASPFPTTAVIELANCVETIYVPTRTAYAVGSYEVTNTTLEPGAGEMLAEAAVRLLRTAAEDN